MAHTPYLRNAVAAALLATLLAGCNLHTMLAAPPAPDPAVPAGAPFGEVRNGQYVVAPGDTVAIVSERTNTPIRTLIDLNRLIPPYALKAGQLLNLQPRGSYVVQRGDTVSGIAARENVSISALIQLNNLRAPYTLQVGQALVLPTSVDAPSTVASAPQPAPSPVTGPQPKPFVPQGGATAPAQIGSTAAPQLGGGITSGSLPPLQGAAQPQPPPAQTQASAPKPLEPAPKAFEPSAPVQSAQIEPPPSAKPAPSGDPLPALKPNSPFIWPVDGKVISKYGPAKDNLRNDGINIAAPVGAPVKAAAAGVVAYAGNELRGFGNMILLRHADGWVTAYAHNSTLLVKKGDKVAQGQTIARVGSSGNVESPQLHFELRQGTKAVDPMKVLTR
jgi:murein DD-endopeptidase MepM/ murein hydrolase activator NlpD